MNYIHNIIGVSLGIGYVAVATYIEQKQTTKLVSQIIEDKKNESDQSDETQYVTVYKCSFLCPKLSGALYKFNGKYISSLDYAKSYGGFMPLGDVKLNEMMDIELKKLMNGELVNGCSKVCDVSIWTLPNILPFGFQTYTHKYTQRDGLTNNGFSRVWW